MEIKEQIQAALARGYGSGINESKSLDVHLIEEMTKEVEAIFNKPLPTTVILEFENFAKGTKIKDLLNALLEMKSTRF